MVLRCIQMAGCSMILAMGLEHGDAHAEGPARDAAGSQPIADRQAATTGDRRSSGAPSSVSGPTQVNEVFTAVAPSGCVYGATVRGTMRTYRAANNEEAKYSPNFLVNAWVTCHGKSELRVRDTPLREISMTRADLEQALTLRALILAGAAPQRCAYVPEVLLDDAGVSLQGIAYLCAATRPSDATVAAPQAPDGAATSLEPSEPEIAETRPTELAVDKSAHSRDVSCASPKPRPARPAADVTPVAAGGDRQPPPPPNETPADVRSQRPPVRRAP
jgi:hypothetical protein